MMNFSGDLHLFFIEENRIFAMENDFFAYDTFPDIGLRRDLIHHIEHDTFHD